MSTENIRLREALLQLEDALGKDFIKKEVHKIKGWPPEGSCGLHPLVLLWYKTREDLAFTELTGCLPHSRWVQETLQLADCLKNYASHPLYQDMLNQLRDPVNWQVAVNQMRNWRERRDDY
ncbi:hypothetical protein JCM39194_06240 [Desulfotomaculum varum]